MAFAHDLRAFAEQAAAKTEHITTEEATKSALIIPFLRVLGYDDANPTEVIPEHVADVGDKKDWKVDYALCPGAADPRPAIIMECKSWHHAPTAQHVTQLGRYFPFTTARFGILTNGLTYQFYADVKEPNVMEPAPFLEVDLTQLSDPVIQEVEQFTKAHFQLDRAVARAEQLYYTRVVKQIFADAYTTPSEAFVRHFIDAIPEKKNTQTVRTQFTPIVAQAFRQFVNDQINARILDRLAQHTHGPGGQNAPADLPARDTGLHGDRATDTKIMTTEEEVQALYIIKALLRGRVAPDRISLRDRQTYCNVLLDDNQNKRLCRLWFNNPEKKQLSLFDADKQEQKVPLRSLDDLYQFADQLLAAVDRYEQKTSRPPRRSPAWRPGPDGTPTDTRWTVFPRPSRSRRCARGRGQHREPAAANRSPLPTRAIIIINSRRAKASANIPSARKSRPGSSPMPCNSKDWVMKWEPWAASSWAVGPVTTMGSGAGMASSGTAAASADTGVLRLARRAIGQSFLGIYSSFILPYYSLRVLRWQNHTRKEQENSRQTRLETRTRRTQKKQQKRLSAPRNKE